MTYKRKRTHSGRLNTPVVFFQLKYVPPYPDDFERVEQYFCLAEVYESSTLDHQFVSTQNSKNVITLIIPNPRTDYRISNGDVFLLQSSMYENIEFNVEHFSPQGELNELMKIVGVAYEV